jgi:hypothetical protein
MHAELAQLKIGNSITMARVRALECMKMPSVEKSGTHLWSIGTRAELETEELRARTLAKVRYTLIVAGCA